MKNSNEMLPKNLLCFSHLRWDFVHQRPQHLLSRFAENSNVYFFEEPVFDTDGDAYLSITKRGDYITLVVPHLATGMSEELINSVIIAMLDKFLQQANMDEWTFWYYTPMSMKFAEKYKPAMVIYDCMDELSAFKFAPAELPDLEKKLMASADLVFTGGQSLYEIKKQHHAHVFPFPSSIEKEHFMQARFKVKEPSDQALLVGPKIGFYGVIDERFDIELIREIAVSRPEWHIILIGPVVKINSDILPKNKNIHYLGQKSYQELPSYLSGWDVALIPFMINESTRYISPTKTPEYLAGGVPVVSTPIRDVVNPYGVKKLVHIAANSKGFISAVELELARKNRKQWFLNVDAYLKELSWDNTYASMLKKINMVINNKNSISIAS
jgi:hypothetical protein